MCLLAICMSSLEKCLFRSFPHLFVFLVLSCLSCLYILEINSLSVFHLILFSSILMVVFSKGSALEVKCKASQGIC